MLTCPCGQAYVGQTQMTISAHKTVSVQSMPQPNEHNLKEVENNRMYITESVTSVRTVIYLVRYLPFHLSLD